MKKNNNFKYKIRNWNDYIKELIDIKDEIPQTNIKDKYDLRQSHRKIRK